MPNHPYGRVYSGYRKKLLRGTYTEMDGEVRVVRVPQVFRPNRGALNRLIMFSSFTVTAALRSLALGPFDVIIGTVPQPFSPLAGWLRSFVGRAKFVLEVRDLWPEGIVATGQAEVGSFAYRGVDAVVSFLYKRADRIVTVTDGIKNALVETRGINTDRIDVVRAGVDVDSMQTDISSYEAKKRLGLEGRFVVTYSGTVGNAHGLDSMLGVSKLLRQDQPDVMILIVGSGAEEETLRSHFVEYQAHNLQLLGQKPRAELPAILAGSDIGLAVLKPSPIFRTVVPTKIYEYMATGLPVLTNVAGETENIITESGAGIAVPNGDDIALAKQIAKLRENPDALKSMSVAGINYARESASWVTRAEQYEEVLEKTVRN